MTTDTALALLRDAAGNLYMAYNAFTRNDAIAWEPLKETADRITALLDSAIKSQPVPVEPEQIKMMRYDEPEGRSDYERAITDYIDSLQSALQVAQMERTAERERGDQWETTATNLLERAEKAEASNKRLVELLGRMQDYSDHKRDRPLCAILKHSEYACDCGYDELLREAGK